MISRQGDGDSNEEALDVRGSERDSVGLEDQELFHVAQDAREQELAVTTMAEIIFALSDSRPRVIGYKGIDFGMWRPRGEHNPITQILQN
jgi:hypothetical protein